jgi:hypothetical protein
MPPDVNGLYQTASDEKKARTLGITGDSGLLWTALDYTLVPGTGIEPVWLLSRGIFFTPRLSPPAFAVCAPDYAFALSLRDLGAPRLVSTPSCFQAWLGIASALG